MKELLPLKGLRGRRLSDLDRAFEDFFQTSGSIRLDVQEKDDEYIVEAELPGFKKEEVTVELTDETLTIKASKEEKKEEEKKNYLHKERRYESMSRQVYLPGALEDGVKAKLSDGMLKITIKRTAREKSGNKIEIE